MSLSNQEIHIYKLIHSCFRYIWKFPARWNSPHYTYLSFKPSKTYKFALIIFALYAIFSLVSAAIINNTPGEQNQIRPIIMGTVGFLMSAFSCVFLLVGNRKLFLFIEHLMRIADSIFIGNICNWLILIF